MKASEHIEEAKQVQEKLKQLRDVQEVVERAETFLQEFENSGETIPGD